MLFSWNFNKTTPKAWQQVVPPPGCQLEEVRVLPVWFTSIAPGACTHACHRHSACYHGSHLPLGAGCCLPVRLRFYNIWKPTSVMQRPYTSKCPARREDEEGTMKYKGPSGKVFINSRGWWQSLQAYRLGAEIRENPKRWAFWTCVQWLCAEVRENGSKTGFSQLSRQDKAEGEEN